MLRILAFAAMLMVGGLLLVGDGSRAGQDTKTKAKGQLPPNWKKLGLAPDQIQKIYDIQAQYRAQIDELEEKIKNLKTKQHEALLKVLTPQQKEHLKKILAEKAGGEDKKDGGEKK